MAVAFSRPPETAMVGMFTSTTNGNVKTYAGGLSVGVGVWQFLAAGVYEEHADYKTVFAFSKLNGPIISFGFAEVDGLVGGFGYNSSLRLPSISERDDAWFKSEKDSIWLAAGLGVKAFQMLDVQAVVCIDLSPNPKVGIYAEAIATLPKGVLCPKQGMQTGRQLCIGVLPPSLGPRRRLGVFCRRLPFPAFRVPSHYPQDLRRLGITWSYDEEVSITGEAYFAITSQAVMGGGRLDLLSQSGHTRASFSAYADFLIFYEPFQFQAGIGVRVSASTRIGWGWLSKATWTLTARPSPGPPICTFGSSASASKFGPSREDKDPLDWGRFYTLVKQCQSWEKARNLPEHLVSLVAGRCSNDSKQELARPPKKGEKLPPPDSWLVRAAMFEFEVLARFPLREVKYNGRDVDEGVKARVGNVYALPMKRGNMFERADMTIKIWDERQGIDAEFGLEAVVKRVPGALWNRCKPGCFLAPFRSQLMYLDETVDSQLAWLTRKQTTPTNPCSTPTPRSNTVMGVRLKPVKSHDSPEKVPTINMKKTFNSLQRWWRGFQVSEGGVRQGNGDGVGSRSGDSS
ncbi:hypothetical protein B0H66DRAFT_633376 [Apodospora peruviana]|uniref:DUF6603 domain-containing protein n=1 Tax=Apodospora peruviana TaxID=516989 RepID=A0AAE0HV64_9PEZI|nr:hypothetical protein B0H66DRAFT_633376 [Apodospora peruviana]